MRLCGAFGVVPERPERTTDDDATTTSLEKNSASHATARVGPPVQRVGGGHGGAVVLVVGRVAFVSCVAPPRVEQIQRKSRVREWTPQNAPRIRAGVTKKDQKAELKKNQTRRCYVKKTRFVFDPTHHTPGAGREITEVKFRRSQTDRAARPIAQIGPTIGMRAGR